MQINANISHVYQQNNYESSNWYIMIYLSIFNPTSKHQLDMTSPYLLVEPQLSW